MKCSKLTEHKRIAVGILCMLILLIVLFSSSYIASEINHECRGEDCPICVCIQQCENTLHSIGNGIVLCASVIIPVVSMLISTALFEFDFTQETLVSKKIRLNN